MGKLAFIKARMSVQVYFTVTRVFRAVASSWHMWGTQKKGLKAVIMRMLDSILFHSFRRINCRRKKTLEPLEGSEYVN
jgi:hypothetical protein